YIYIHGTDEEGRLGAPASHGCIRMSNRAVVELFDRVGVDTLVVIARQRQ
ncbi:MAG: L,D-transpeptidase, partial [Thiothrix sp.]|nr:L,D-transpeptidase [Thiothrix sp.]